ncbi:hypothetical protein EVAR_12069_1 [Eumeta japonica]|uniref:Uncharacterized protein n=1 Tax=Eumeta variegata TaxID=151549 RepID=A0A4C1U5C6_EUMVA|nr:hypothetical protein EVAR_12069_1 [Eumeta japonica]
MSTRLSARVLTCCVIRHQGGAPQQEEGLLGIEETNVAGLVDIASVCETSAQKYASATSATADGLAPEGASQTKKFCLQVIKKRPRKPDVADVHEWCSAATDYL